MKAVSYSDEEVASLGVEIPPNMHGGFKNWLGLKTGRLDIISYAGKVKANKHCWFAKCACGTNVLITSTGLCTSKSCGCLGPEITSIVNKGNNYGIFSIKTERTIANLKSTKPNYLVVDSKDGKVMTKWDFYCEDCDSNFSARPDNILVRGSGGGQTPCKCKTTNGYNKSLDGCLYVLSAGNFCKFGISNNFERRYKELSKAYGSQMELEFLLIKSDGAAIEAMERIIKQEFNYCVDVGDIDGKTEYRAYEDCENIIRRICELLKTI